MPLQDAENLNIPKEENEAPLNAEIETEDEISLEGEDASEKNENIDSLEKISIEKISETATAGETTVENIENIEKVEITGRGISTFMTYFPHLIVGLISLIALAGLIFIMYANSKNPNTDPSETARSLITYLVAVFTIVIALTLTLMAFFGNMKDFKERFAMGKEVLTILIGVLGTIIGFYFGSAAPENKTQTNAPPAATSDSNSATNTNTPTVTTAATFTANNNSSYTPTDMQKQFAKVKEREGFENLIAGDYDASINAFQSSENAWNGFHNTYDIARLLRKNKTHMNEPDIKKEVFGIIVSQYSYGAPTDLLEQIKTIASQ